MSEKWTVEKLRAAKSECILFGDKDKGGWLRMYAFPDIPELSVMLSAETRRSEAKRTFTVGEMELPDDLQAVCDVLNGEPS